MFVYPVFEQRPLASIRATEIQAWVRGLSSKLAPASVEVCYRYVSSIFRSAVRDRLLESSPCDRIRLPKKERRAIVPPEVEHVERLVASMPDRYRALVVFAAGTGLRQGEVFGLKLDRVDFLRRSIEVSSQLVDGAPAPLKTRCQLSDRAPAHDGRTSALGAPEPVPGRRERARVHERVR